MAVILLLVGTVIAKNDGHLNVNKAGNTNNGNNNQVGDSNGNGEQYQEQEENNNEEGTQNQEMEANQNGKQTPQGRPFLSIWDEINKLWDAINGAGECSCDITRAEFDELQEDFNELKAKFEALEGIQECISGETRDCYTGDPETRNVGECHDGTESCENYEWSGICIGQVLPDSEICWDELDNNCDGQVDEGCIVECLDIDDDGYDICGTSNPNDTDSLSADCDDSNPEVNPGQIEICNGVDDNCDGNVDEGFDLMTDLENCGVCGQVCELTETCVSGYCVTQ